MTSFNPQLPLSPDMMDALTGCGVVRFGERPRELRRCARLRPATHSVMLVLDRNRAAAPPFVRLRDISQTGLGLLVSADLDVGDPFATRIRRADGPPVWVHCTATRRTELDSSLRLIGARINRVVVAPQPVKPVRIPGSLVVMR